MRKSRMVAALLLVGLATSLCLSALFLDTSAGSRSVAYAVSEWTPNTYYAVGAVVTYQGTTYTCLQAHTSQVGWEPPNVPALWQAGGSAGPTPTATPRPTNTPGPTPTPTATPRPATPTPTPTPGGTGCGSAPAYSSSAVYTNGMQVSYNGHLWQAKWWTQGEAPSTGGSGVWQDLGPCSANSTPTPTTGPTPTATPRPTTGPTPTAGPTPTPTPPPGNFEKVAYFNQWGIYSNAFYPKNLVTNGDAAKITTLIYAFENIDPTNLTCFETIKASDSSNESNPNAGDGAGDAFADYQKSYGTDISVDGVADVYSQPIKGNFNQLKKLKTLYPNMRILVSIGGWTYSKYFSDAAATSASRQKFVSSCIDMFIKGNLPQVGGDSSGGAGSGAGIFDGFDLDWEYVGAPGHTGNHYGPQDTANYTALLAEFRNQLNALGGRHYYLTAAIPSGQEKIAKIQTNQVGNYFDFIDLMAYDMHGGGFEPSGPTNFQSPLHDTPADPSQPIPPGTAKYNVDTAVQALTQGLPAYGAVGGFPANKIVLGIPFYARGWTGVSAGSTNGVYRPATGPSPSFSLSATAGVAFWKELVSAGLTANLSWDSATQSSYIFSGGNFYTLDSPQAISAKGQYIKSKGLGGAMVYSLEGDDAQATLFKAVVAALS